MMKEFWPRVGTLLSLSSLLVGSTVLGAFLGMSLRDHFSWPRWVPVIGAFLGFGGALIQWIRKVRI